MTNFLKALTIIGEIFNFVSFIVNSKEKYDQTKTMQKLGDK